MDETITPPQITEGKRKEDLCKIELVEGMAVNLLPFLF